ncbi:chorismate-binding protein [Sediminicola luteus]|uniref:isochorismate synthase n=1 Tax=Sediminicola luteus TaxID=319238 RepID=A0A2A4G7D7_9FLAO|nr:chorismate-binding protein [Sediminicola luteus]PCE63890.1 hypothetical protein B7P33_11555 [Sediminicola luteus]
MRKSTLAHWQKAVDQGLPFVLYRKPAQGKVRLWQQQSVALHTMHPESRGFVMAPFSPTEPSYVFSPDVLTDFEWPREQRTGGYDFSADADAVAQNQHINLVSQGIDAIKKGVFEKVVLSRKWCTTHKKDPLTLFTALLDSYPQAFCYLWYHPKVGMWAGASPELLLKTKAGSLQTMALAGTQQVQGETDPQWTPKEIEEQAIVSRYLQQRLDPWLTEMELDGPENVKSGHLWHICTHLKGQYHRADFNRILEQLHPTPAVCGHPKEKAQAFILAHEGYDRKFYTGFFGELNMGEAGADQSELYVNLRCMELRGQVADIYVGGGITIDSDPEKEWDETVKKSRAMGKVLQ